MYYAMIPAAFSLASRLLKSASNAGTSAATESACVSAFFTPPTTEAVAGTGANVAGLPVTSPHAGT